MLQRKTSSGNGRVSALSNADSDNALAGTNHHFEITSSNKKTPMKAYSRYLNYALVVAVAIYFVFLPALKDIKNSPDYRIESQKLEVMMRVLPTTRAVIHVGPGKTGTTTIQKLSGLFFESLHSDGYEMPWTHPMKRELSRDIAKENQVCFGACFVPKSNDDRNLRWTTQCEPELLLSGLSIAQQKKNLFVTSEMLWNIDTLGVKALSNYLQSWDKVTVIYTYRRLYDRLQSKWNQASKIDVFRDLTLPKESKVDRFSKRNEYDQYMTLISSFREAFDDVVMINYHDTSKGLPEAFYCDAFPNANRTCKAVKEYSGKDKYNTAVEMEYGQIALGASEMGLIPKIESTKNLAEVVMRIKAYQEKTLGLTRNDFNMKCLNESFSNELLNKSLELEKFLFPDFFASSLGEAALKSDFDLQKTTTLCDLDLNATLQSPDWQAFFKSPNL